MPLLLASVYVPKYTSRSPAFPAVCASPVSPRLASRSTIPNAGTLRTCCTITPSGNEVRWPLRTREHRVRLVVVLEALLHRIPEQLAFRLHRHVMEQARRAGAMRDFDRRDRLLARADAVEPVAVMILALVEMDFVGFDHRRDDLWVAGRERLAVLQLRHRIAGGDRLVAARDEDPALAADELDAVGEVAADDHPDAVRVDPFGAERAVDVPQPF